MKLVCISDTHSAHREMTIPECDILISAGDFTNKGEYFEIAGFLNWMSQQPAKHKVFIAGNHELTLDKRNKNRASCRQLIDSYHDIIYLEDSHTVIGEVLIYGTPWTPAFYDWAFNGADRPEQIDEGYPPLEDIYASIHEDTQILICHGPPRGYADKGYRDRLGSIKLLERIKQLKKLELVICGHIHTSGGVMEKLDNIQIVNAASLKEDYVNFNDMVILEGPPWERIMLTSKEEDI